MNINPKGRKRHDSVLREKFGIGLYQYEQLYAKQNGKCYLCESDSERNLAVDHCHTTGNVRRLLCSQCNQALGLFKDNAEVMRKAAAYVESKFDLPEDVQIEAKPHAERPRWRNIVYTPAGEFNSFAEAGIHYQVDTTTIGAWCGAYKYRLHLQKEGFSFDRVFK